MGQRKKNKNLQKNAITSAEANTGFISLPQEKRFLVLFQYVKKNYSKKVIIYVTSPLTAQFCEEFMQLEGLTILTIHEKQSKSTQKETFNQFVEAASGILVWTNIVAKPFKKANVNVMVQFDPPHDISEYINRLKMVASYENCQCLLFTIEEEMEFIRYLKSQCVKVEFIDVPLTKLGTLQIKLEKLVKEKYAIYLSARQGYAAYLKAYRDHHDKEIFSLSNIKVTKVANSFGFKVAPFFDLNPPSLSEGKGKSKTRRIDIVTDPQVFKIQTVYKRIKRFKSEK